MGEDMNIWGLASFQQGSLGVLDFFYGTWISPEEVLQDTQEDFL
jgi:hypothetical protein